jgi:hypothetical protein
MAPVSNSTGAAFDLVCRMVRPSPDLEQVREALRRDVDFGELLQVASDHSVRPQLIRTLADMKWESVPLSVRSQLEEFHRIHGAFSLGAADQLGRVFAVLAERGIRAATFKGGALAAVLYRDLAAREYNDIDLIVPPNDVDAAEDALEALGYRSLQGDRRFRRAFLGHQRQYAFVHAEQATVDLHWDFTAEHVPFPLAASEIWTALEEVTIGQHQVAVLGTVERALLLAGHGTKERWRSLGWVCDFALMVEDRREIDWTEIHRRARARGCGDCVLLACAMAERLLAVAVPDALALQVRENMRVDALASALVVSLRRDLPEAGQRHNLADLDLCDSRWDRLVASLRIGLTPTVSDYHAMPLPPPLWPLYRVTRPFRLAFKVVGIARAA